MPADVDTEPRKKNDKNENDEWQKLLLALLFLLLSFACILCSSQSALWFINRDRIEASMLSDMSAYYGHGSPVAMAPLSGEIAAEAARDEEVLLLDQTPVSAGIAVAVLPAPPVPTPTSTPEPISPATPIAAVPSPTEKPSPEPTDEPPPVPTNEPTQEPTQEPTSEPPTSEPPTSDPPPSDPPPSDPPPSDPEPSDPEPSDPEPSDPEPSDPEPSDPEPSDPEPSDPEPPPNLSISDVTVFEGNSGTINAVFIVTLSPASSQLVSVDYATANDTALAPGDYTAIPITTLNFPVGVTTRLITVIVQGDTLYENDETFFVNLANANNANISDSQGVGTISNDEAQPSLSIDDVTVTEGDSGTTVDAIFTVTLSPANSQPVNVDYATANDTALAPGDYTAIPITTLNFPVGVTTRLITVIVQGETLYEDDETFFVNLANANNANISDDQGLGTIINDDLPNLSISNALTVTEGNSGTVDAIFTVTLSPASSQSVSVDYATANDTALAPDDYTAIPISTLNFPVGVTTQFITVTVQGDTLDEADETFFVDLTNPSNAIIVDSQGLGTISDDDPSPTLSIDDVTVTEGDSGTVNAVFTVTLSAASGQLVSVDYATADDSALAPDDYTAIPISTLNFPVGVITQFITVTVQGETLYENDETFFVDLTNPGNVNIPDPQGQGTIINDDLLEVDFESNAYSADESNGPAVITVTLSTTSALPVTVDYATNPSSGPIPAAVGSDYVATSGTLTFTPGITSQTFNVAIINDINAESPETVQLDLSNASTATLGTANNPATLTITDADDSGTCSNSGTPVDIGPPDCDWTNIGGSTITVTLTVTVDGDSDYDLVYYERESASTQSEIAMDRVRIDVATNLSGPWSTIFYWGDAILDANTNIGQAGYGGSGNEPNNEPIPMTNPPLYQSSAGGPITGIAIDVDNLPVGPPLLGDCGYIRLIGIGGEAEVDSLEVLPP